jgi:hypothetical protein
MAQHGRGDEQDAAGQQRDVGNGLVDDDPEVQVGDPAGLEGLPEQIRSEAPHAEVRSRKAGMGSGRRGDAGQHRGPARVRPLDGDRQQQHNEDGAPH